MIDSDAKAMVVIGANGAGKSRFTSVMIKELSGKAVKISAIKALFMNGSKPDGLPGSIDSLYMQAVESKMIPYTESTGFERLMALLMHEEIVNLISYKVALAEAQRNNTHPTLPPTCLDSVISLWQELFPGNRILLHGGKMLFSRNAEGDPYSPLRLSDGEQAVLYYIGATLRAIPDATIFVDSPTALLHPSVSSVLWDRLEALRPDCTFVYTTHDLDFASSRTNAEVVWVRDYDATASTWDYSILPPHSGLPDEVYLAIIGSRRPVLFIEGDDVHSIDSKLYPLIFPNHTVKALGSCNKVIEAVRSFNGLESFHHLDSYGIVDRDRRDSSEVAYLRGKRILVPAVAEVENLLMLEEIVRTVAHRHGRDENKVFEKVRHSVIASFASELKAQAMLHTRHRVKRTVEYRIDGRFNNINSLEDHMHELVDKINPRGLYEGFCREFRGYVAENDYASVLRVYNRKTMISSSNVASLCGAHGNRDGYLGAILDILRGGGKDAERIRRAVRRAFDLSDTDMCGKMTSEDTQSKIQLLDNEN
ncbi:MAG: DUF4435 domain-containing protein [Muribaculaceae bacterium]|nr:DUF4435 domain-containing protein [Muribaculaceae bacterium]